MSVSEERQEVGATTTEDAAFPFPFPTGDPERPSAAAAATAGLGNAGGGGGQATGRGIFSSSGEESTDASYQGGGEAGGSGTGGEGSSRGEGGGSGEGGGAGTGEPSASGSSGMSSHGESSGGGEMSAGMLSAATVEAMQQQTGRCVRACVHSFVLARNFRRECVCGCCVVCLHFVVLCYVVLYFFFVTIASR